MTFTEMKRLESGLERLELMAERAGQLGKPWLRFCLHLQQTARTVCWLRCPRFDITIA